MSWPLHPWRPPAEAFDRVYRDRMWGKGSGEGSNPKNAFRYIQYVERFLQEHSITSVLDCGCGDLQIASSVDWGSTRYLGIDTSQEALRLASSRLRPGLKVRHADISTEDWCFDLVLIKEVFQHLPFEQIQECLLRLKHCKYLLITNDVPHCEEDIPRGAYRPIDVREAPFFLRAEPVLEYELSTKKLVLLVTQER